MSNTDRKHQECFNETAQGAFKIHDIITNAYVWDMFGESRQDGYKKHHFLTANKSQLKWLPDILIHLCQVKINQRTLNVQETIFFKSHQINSSYTALIKKNAA